MVSKNKSFRIILAVQYVQDYVRQGLRLDTRLHQFQTEIECVLRQTRVGEGRHAVQGDVEGRRCVQAKKSAVMVGSYSSSGTRLGSGSVSCDIIYRGVVSEWTDSLKHDMQMSIHDNKDKSASHGYFVPETFPRGQRRIIQDLHAHML